MIALAKANYFEEQFEKLKDENLRIGLNSLQPQK